MKTARSILATASLAAGLLCTSLAAPDHDFTSGNPPRDINAVFREALFAEEAEQDLVTAIEGYETVLERYEDARRIAASAVFRLGECYRKQGKDEEAIAQFRRLLAEFPAEETLAKISRENLAALGEPADETISASPIPPPLSGRSNVPLAGAGFGPEEAALARARKILEESPDRLGESSPSQLPLLFTAVGDGYLKVAKYLLDAGADPNLDRPEKGGTPLQIAIARGSLPMIELLIANGADVNLAASPNGSTAVHLAVAKGYTDILEALLKHKPDLTAQAKLSVPEKISKYRRSHFTNGDVWAAPLHRACLDGDPKIVCLLIEAGADPKADSEFNLEPIHYAVSTEREANREEILKILVALGADVNATDKYGRTALWLAVQDLQIAPVEYLLKQGADPNAADTLEGKTPLNLVLESPPLNNLPPGESERRQRKLIDTLVANGADVGKAGPSALAHAIARFDTELLTLFLENGGDANVIHDKSRQTMLYIVLDVRKPDDLFPAAALGKRFDMMKILVAHGADVNLAPGQAGLNNTILAKAFSESGAVGGDEDAGPGAWNPIIDYLVDRGADPKALLQDRNTRNNLAAQRPELYDRLRILVNLREIGDERANTIWAEHEYDNTFSYRLQKVFTRATPSESPPRLAEFLIRTFENPNNSSYNNRTPDLDQLVILRRTGDGNPDETIEIDYTKIADAGDPDADPELRWGDIVTFRDGDDGNRIDWKDLRGDLSPFLARAAYFPVTVQLADDPPREAQVRPFGGRSGPAPNGYSSAPNFSAPGDFYWSSDGEYRSLIANTGWRWRADLDVSNVRIVRGGGDETVLNLHTIKTDPRVVRGDMIIIPAAAALDIDMETVRAGGIWIARPKPGFLTKPYQRDDNPRPPRLLDVIAHSFADPSFVLPVPDFSKVVIRRRVKKKDGPTEIRLPVDVAAFALEYKEPTAAPANDGNPFANDDPSDDEAARHNPVLEWGDIVEIPQVPGSDPGKWTGLSEEMRAYLKAQTSIRVDLEPEGHEPRTIAIGYRVFDFLRDSFGWNHKNSDQFVLNAARRNRAGPYLSTLIADHLSAKDWDLGSVLVSGVDGVRRRVNVQKGDDLLLHDGDVIEVRKQL